MKGSGRRGRLAVARGAGRDALQGPAAGRRRHDAGPGPPGGQALRRHGAGTPGGRARTTCTARCGTWISTPCSTGSWIRPARTPPSTLTPLEERLEHDEYESRIERLKKEVEAEIRRRLVADRGVEAMAKTLRKPLPEDVDFMHASREEMASLRKAIYPADPQAGRAPGPQAPPRAQGPARLPLHRPPLAQLRRGAGRAQVPLPAAVQARDLRGGRHLRLGGRVRPVHPAPGVRHLRVSSPRSGPSCSSTASTR